MPVNSPESPDHDPEVVTSRWDRASLSEARAYVQRRRDDGVRCPCCEQFAKVYRRHINDAMARALIEMFKVLGTSEEFMHMTSFAGANAEQLRLWRGGDYAKLRYWGLIEEKPLDHAESADKRSSGFWRMTPRGVNFVLRRITVPKYVYLYDGLEVKVDGPNPDVDILDCLKKKFNYADLMSGAAYTTRGATA